MKIDDIKVSTKTIIAISNCVFDIVKIFTKFPVRTEPKNGSVEVMYYQNDYRGVVYADFRPRKKRSFRNAINIISVMDDGKKINFKLSKNGKFQMTGCKNDNHAITVVKTFIEDVFNHCPDTIEINDNSDTVKIYFQTVMTNIDFPLGFAVDRQKLDDLMNKNTPFHSLLETSFGYTGVNIKFPLDLEWWDIPVPCISCNRNKIDEWTLEQNKLSECLEVTSAIRNKKKYNTFLVFHSGSVIMSGMMKETMRHHYNLFMSIMKTCKNKIEEKLL